MNKGAVIALLLVALIAWYLLQPSQPAVEVSEEGLNKAIGKGAEFLKGKIEQDELELDCRSSSGPCQVSGQGRVAACSFIVDAMLDELSESEREKLSSMIWVGVLDGRWSYGENTPVDLDDTAYAIRALRMLGRTAPSLSDLVDEFYDEKSGGFRTFKPESFHEPDEHGEFPAAELALEPGEEGNDGIHPEVSANFCRILLGGSLEDHIDYGIVSRSQAPDGSWHSFFYPGKYHSTYMNLALLCSSGKLKEERDGGITFLLSSQESDGSWGGNAYETALALNSLAVCSTYNEQYRKGVGFLLGSQGADGSWSASEPVWEFHFQGDILEGLDSERVITTSLAVKALKSAKMSGLS